MEEQLQIRRINSRLDLDPDFGTVTPKMVEAYTVIVSPQNEKPEYSFVLMLPELESLADSNSLFDIVLQEFLDEGDQYLIKGFTDQDASMYNPCTPLLGFDPGTIGSKHMEFLWLTPPAHLRH